jgi:hypothetical protein
LPDLAIEPSKAAVQVIGRVVGTQEMRRPVEIEPGIRDAAGISPNHRAGVQRIFEVFVEAIEAEHDVAEEAMPVWCLSDTIVQP